MDRGPRTATRRRDTAPATVSATELGRPAPSPGTMFHVRGATAHDAAGIAAIWNHEALGTLTTTDTEPRSLAAQRRWLASHSATYPVVVATPASRASTVAGFAALTAYRPKPAFRHTVEDSIYVDRRWRGSGVGRLLLRELLHRAAAQGHRSVIARITTANVASRRLHESFGFRLIGIEQAVAFKLGCWLDVAVYQRLI